MQVAVTKDGNLIYSGVFGSTDWDDKRPMESYSRSRIGSTTKVMVTLGMLKLIEDNGDLSLDTNGCGTRKQPRLF